MRLPRIPPMITDIVQTAICAFDGAEFTRLAECPSCGGQVQGYDIRQKKFAVLQEADHEHTIAVRVKRFTCRSCGRLCYADEPFYPDTRLGSLIIDLYATFSSTIPKSRAARVVDAMGIRVNRTTWRNYQDLLLAEIPTSDVFGIRLPLSVLSLSSLAARTPDGCCIDGAEALAACGFPSAYRAVCSPAFPGEERGDRDEQEPDEEQQYSHP